MTGLSLVKRFVVSRICSSLGDQVLMFAVPLIVYRNTNSVAMSGLAFFIEWLPRVISLPIAGSIADRLGGWRIYPIGDGTRAVAAFLAVAFAGWFPGDTFALVTALIALSAFLYAQVTIATEVTVARLVDADAMPKAQSLLQAVDQSAMIVGPALAALSAIWIAPIALLWGVGVLFAASALVALTLRSSLTAALAPFATDTKRHIFADLTLGLRIVAQTPVLMKLIVLGMLANLTVGIAFASSAAITVGRYGLPNSSYGILQVAIGAMALTTYALVPLLTKQVSVFMLGMCSYALIIGGGYLMSFAPTFTLFAVGFAFASGLCGLFNVYVRTERVNWIPREHLGKTIGLLALLNQATLPLAGLLVSTLAARVGVQTLLGCAATVALILFGGLAVSLRRTCKTAIFERTSEVAA